VSDEIGYAEAMTELEGILDELEGDHLDVDVLADRVRRASELIKLCRTRIGGAQADVDRIVTDLEAFERELDGEDAGDDEGADESGEEDDQELF
jgi:exodeoxyribonuclease VII small subunit